MPLLGSAAVAMWWDISAELRGEFEDWHSHEHFPERLGIPGFLRGSRWADHAGGDGFFVMYELDAYATLTSPHYLARLNDPTPWSTKMMPHHRNMVRSLCHIEESFGGGVARSMATIRLSPVRSGERLARPVAWAVVRARAPSRHYRRASPSHGHARSRDDTGTGDSRRRGCACRLDRLDWRIRCPGGGRHRARSAECRLAGGGWSRAWIGCFGL